MKRKSEANYSGMWSTNHVGLDCPKGQSIVQRGNRLSKGVIDCPKGQSIVQRGNQLSKGVTVWNPIHLHQHRRLLGGVHRRPARCSSGVAEVQKLLKK